jgi:hypothetical protein
MKQYAEEEQAKHGHGVLQIDSRGQYPFDSVSELLRAVNCERQAQGLKPRSYATVAGWVDDGLTHDGFRYEREAKEERG